MMETESKDGKIDSLPKDTVVDILAPFTARSVGKLRTLLKAWQDITSTKEFIFAHAAHRIKKLLLTLEGNDEDFPLISLTMSSTGSLRGSHRATLAETGIPLDFLGHPNIVGSCSGLLCLHQAYTRIVLWSPTLKAADSLPLPNPRFTPEAIGFGAVESYPQDLKVVLLAVKDTDYGNPEATMEALVYRMVEGRWSAIEPNIHVNGNAVFDGGVCCGSFCAWILRWFNEDFKPVEQLLTFEVTDETFKLTPVPSDKYPFASTEAISNSLHQNGATFTPK